MVVDEHIDDGLGHKYIHTYIHKYSDFLVVMISVGLASACPTNYSIHESYRRLVAHSPCNVKCSF